MWDEFAEKAKQEEEKLQKQREEEEQVRRLVIMLICCVVQAAVVVYLAFSCLRAVGRHKRHLGVLQFDRSWQVSRLAPWCCCCCC
jgi:ABC-type transport system involved in cytochrome bd biosynthesis fused ATPase/permease subunit